MGSFADFMGKLVSEETKKIGKMSKTNRKLFKAAVREAVDDALRRKDIELKHRGLTDNNLLGALASGNVKKVKQFLKKEDKYK